VSQTNLTPLHHRVAAEWRLVQRRATGSWLQGTCTTRDGNLKPACRGRAPRRLAPARVPALAATISASAISDLACARESHKLSKFKACAHVTVHVENQLLPRSRYRSTMCLWCLEHVAVLPLGITIAWIRLGPLFGTLALSWTDSVIGSFASLRQRAMSTSGDVKHKTPSPCVLCPTSIILPSTTLRLFERAHLGLLKRSSLTRPRHDLHGQWLREHRAAAFDTSEQVYVRRDQSKQAIRWDHLPSAAVAITRPSPAALSPIGGRPGHHFHLTRTTESTSRLRAAYTVCTSRRERRQQRNLHDLQRRQLRSTTSRRSYASTARARYLVVGTIRACCAANNAGGSANATATSNTRERGARSAARASGSDPQRLLYAQNIRLPT